MSAVIASSTKYQAPNRKQIPMTNDRMTNSLARRGLVTGATALRWSAWLLVLFCLDGSAAAQDAWPGYSSSFSGPNEIARGPGFYFAIWKLVLLLVVIWIWIKSA